MKYLLLSLSFLIIFQSGYGQLVSGVVSDETGEPIPGVNVVVLNTNQGSITDFNGQYSLEVNSLQDSLQFTFIGMQSKIVPIAGRNVVNVVLGEDVKQLNEVVVTAVGIEKQKKSIGYAVAEVDEELLQQRSEPDVLRVMTGKVPGVEIIGSNGAPGSATRMQIRGFSTPNENQPLIIVDGVPFNNETIVSSNPLSGGSTPSNRLADLNPQDILSINVLKGASASVLYGARAANGVVIITTKAGAGGIDQQGLEVTYSGSYNIEEVQKLPDFQNTYGQGADFVFNNGFYGSWGPRFSERDNVPHHYSDPEQWGDVFPQFIGEEVPYRPYPDNVRDFYKTGALIENTISLNGGGENSSFYASFARVDHEGFIPSSEFTKNNFNIGGRYRLANEITFGGTITYVNSEQTGIQAGGGAAGASPVHSQLWYIPRNFDLQGLPYRSPITGDNVYYRSTLDNPRWNAENNLYNSEVDRVYGNLYASYDPFEWLNVTYKIGMNAYSNFVTDIVDVSSNIDVATYNKRGGITTDDIFQEEIDQNLILTNNFNLTDEIGLRAVVGFNYNIRNFDRQSVVGTQLITRGIADIDNAAKILPNGGSLIRRRIAGAYLDATFSYQNVLFLNYQARNDWTSTLPADNRSYFFQGVNGSFVFTEAFDLTGAVLSYGKLRAGIGTVGKDAPAYRVNRVYTGNPTFGNNLASYNMPYTDPFTGAVSGLINQAILANDNLQPEFTTEFEIGLEASFFDGFAGLDFTYYNRTTTDLIIDADIPTSTGFQLRSINVGEINNHGIEIGLDLNPVTVGNFNWNLFTTFTRNISEVVSLGEDRDRIGIGYGFTGDFGAYLVEGEPYGVILGTDFEKDELTGEPLINVNTGLPFETRESQIIADPNRDFQMGFNNTFTWKGLSLAILIDWAKGGQFYSATAANMLGRGVLGITAENREAPRVLPGVLADINGDVILDESGNRITNDIMISANDFWWQGFAGSNSADAAAVYDADVIKLREVVLSYQLPKSVFNDIFIGSATVTLTGRNLWFYAPGMPEGSAIDPDNGGGQLDNVRAFDFAYIPNARRYGVNLRFTF